MLIILLFSLAASVSAKENISSPFRKLVNELALKSTDKTVQDIQNSINSGKLTKLKKYSSSDQQQVQETLKAMKKHNVRVHVTKAGFNIIAKDYKVEIKLLDFISQTYSYNGKAYQWDHKNSFEQNQKNIMNLLGHKVSSTNLPLINEAHALVPLVFVGYALVAGGSAGLVTDFFGSRAVNSLKNIDRETQAKVKELEEKYKSRAETCEQDLGRAKSNPNNKNYIEGLSSVRVVGKLHHVLNAELYDKWLNGIGRIDYDDVDCEKLANKEGFSIGSVSGLFRAEGGVLGKLCAHHDRLNACFKETEEIMRENEVNINTLQGPDRTGPYEDLTEEYRQLNQTKNK